MADYEILLLEQTDTLGKFEISPLPNHFARTFGNSLRRVLLSSVPGAAVNSIYIDGIYHEFSGIEGIREDVASIILNLKRLILKMDLADNNPYTLTIDETGPKVITAGDIKTPEGVEILNKDLVIGTLSADHDFKMDMTARLGRGYVGADVNKHIYQQENVPLGTIFTDSIYAPVKRVGYQVEPIKGDPKLQEKLTMEIETDGSIVPRHALSVAAKILRDHITIVQNLSEALPEKEEVSVVEEQEEINPIQQRQIEDLELSVRSYNCLKRAGITTLEELTQKTESEMMHVRNLGKKSLQEVKDKLEAQGLSFKPEPEEMPED